MLGRLLENRYQFPEWALVFELNKGVGAMGGDRRIDAAAFNCYPSNGLVRHAFEFKTSRSDFIRELNNPQKRKWAEDNFHETYFVTTAGIVKENEIPEGWGLLVATKNGDALRRKIIAKHREAPPLPEKTALSAIRSLAHSLSNLDLPYAIAGQEVKKEDVEKWANRILDDKRKRLQEEERIVHKKLLELNDMENKLIGPFKVLREAIGDISWSERQDIVRRPAEIITADNVRNWLLKVADSQANRLLEEAIVARDALSKMIEKANN